VFGTSRIAFAAGPRPSGPGRSATRPAGPCARAAAGVRAWEENPYAQAACLGSMVRLLVQPDHGLETNRAARRGSLMPVRSHSAGRGSGTAP
jgi:hypothetical protein